MKLAQLGAFLAVFRSCVEFARALKATFFHSQEPHEAARLLLYCLGNTAALATTFECVRWDKGRAEKAIQPHQPAIYEQGES